MVSLQDVTTYEQSISAMTGDSQSDTYKEGIYILHTLLHYNQVIIVCSGRYFSLLIFRQAIVCAHCALATHSRDNTVTLASLELLAGLARLQFDSHSKSDIPFILRVHSC